MNFIIKRLYVYELNIDPEMIYTPSYLTSVYLRNDSFPLKFVHFSI